MCVGLGAYRVAENAFPEKSKNKDTCAPHKGNKKAEKQDEDIG